MTTTEHQDPLIRAVMERDEMVRLLHSSHSTSAADARERVFGYLEELRTTQRYRLYRSLQHPLYPIFRKIQRIVEHPEIPQQATKAGRVIYVSNHKSHTDYIVELLVLDDHGIRPPIIAAGINLFGGPLGLIQRHVTGAIPIRRNTKDPVYLITLKAYVAEVLKEHDLFFYPEGGRSYSGEIKAPKTGLLHAAMQAEVPDGVIVPAAVAYDIVLEDRALARQGGTKRRQRPFTAELAEMMTLAVGFKTRAFVTFGEPIPLGDYHHESRRDVLDLAHRTRDVIGKLYKVLPTAIVATAMRPSIDRGELESRVDELLGRLRDAHANLAVRDAGQAIEEGVAALERRDILRVEGSRIRIRNRNLLRYYARTIQHLQPASH
ncbi:MAG: 1-acyl-sn-glycerol-3-phosphate acyltransferase [Acidobacteria bacterium]|nr:1-acyl-sn-glycerol-3-phosphate acyltransferase [Acidobacteriota bacterium]